MHASQLSTLISHIYECALDPGKWTETLEQLCNAFESAAATLAVVDLVTGAERQFANVGVSPEYLKSYQERFRTADLFLHPLLLRDVGEPALSSELVSDTELKESLIYREWAAPQGFRDTLLMTLLKEPSRIAFLGLTRRENQRRYDEQDCELMRLLSPHILRVIAIADLLDHRTLERDRFAEVVDALTTSVLLIDEGGRLLHANPSGEDLLQREVVLRVRAGHVQPVDPLNFY
jgi:PAS domain-containing protein